MMRSNFTILLLLATISHKTHAMQNTYTIRGPIFLQHIGKKLGINGKFNRPYIINTHPQELSVIELIRLVAQTIHKPENSLHFADSHTIDPADKEKYFSTKSHDATDANAPFCLIVQELPQ